MNNSNPQLLNNQLLITELKVLVNNERLLLSKLLDYLSEVDSRRLYLELGYPSLFEFCVRELNYSEASAQRRISAMRLIKDLPKDNMTDIKTKLQTGSLNLTTLSQVSVFLKSEKKLNNKTYTKAAKTELINKLENKSKRECERELLKISPISAMPQEKEKQITENKTLIQVVIDDDLKLKLERIKSLTSHKNPNPSYAELLNQMAEIVLAKIDPVINPAKVHAASAIKSQSHDLLPPAAVKPVNNNSRYIPLNIKRFVWRRDQGKCQFEAVKTEKDKHGRDIQIRHKCSSMHFIQIDHIKPYSQNGSSTDAQNLRLLCGQHNRWRHGHEG